MEVWLKDIYILPTTLVYNPATYDKEGNLVTGTNPNKTTNHYSLYRVSGGI